MSPYRGFVMTFARTAAFCGFIAAIPSLTCAQELAPVVLNSLTAAPDNIASARVLDQNGRVLGQALRVQTDQDGKPSAIAFRAADGRGTIVLAAAAVSYDGSVLIAGNDQPQIVALTQPQRTAAAQ
jgi:hypothetical protein